MPAVWGPEWLSEAFEICPQSGDQRWASGVVEKCPQSGDQSCFFEVFEMRWIMVAAYAEVGVGVELTVRRLGISSCLLAVH